MSAWKKVLPAVVITAAVQAALVWPALTPSSGALFLLLVAASFAVTVAAVSVIAGAFAPAPNWQPLVAWSAAIVLVAVLTAIAALALTPVVLLLGLITVPPVAHAVSPHRGFLVFRRHPAHAILLSLGMLALSYLAWIAALLLGFFVTGVLGAFATWLVFGAVGTVGLRSFSALYRRTTAEPPAQD